MHLFRPLLSALVLVTQLGVGVRVTGLVWPAPKQEPHPRFHLSPTRLTQPDPRRSTHLFQRQCRRRYPSTFPLGLT